MATRGRPRKTAQTINQTATPAQDAREAASTASAPETAKDVPERVDAPTEAPRGQSCDIAKYLCVAARLAAADTVRTCQHKETVLRDAIKEGLLAYSLLREIEGGAQ